MTFKCVLDVKAGIPINKPPIYRIFFLQVALTLVTCSVFALINGRVAAYSSLIGGSLFALPQLYFGIKAFMYSGARAIQNIVTSFYKGESTKVVVIACGFAVVFSLVKPLDYFALYFTFISVLIFNCFTPYLVNLNNTK